jgi:hypothetical protein
MKAKFICFVVAFFLLTTSAFAGPWMIDSFDNSPDPGEADDYIAAESSDGLKPVQPTQVTVQSGRLYVRQKFEDPFAGADEEPVYQLFQGRATEKAKSLGRISVDGIPYSTLLRMKFFYNRGATGDGDLENVYFDGKDILVEGEDPIYVNLNGKMEELKPSSSREFKISVTSTPPGATVSVANVEKGKTPVTFSVGSAKTTTVVISMEGYYTTIKAITPSDKVIQEGVSMVAKAPLENPAAAYRTKLQAATASKDASAIKSIKADIQKTLSNFTADTKKTVDAIMTKFPANPPKAPSESDADFSARKTVWTNTQSRERDAMNKQAQEHFNELKDLLAEADATGGDMDFALKYEYIPNSSITFTSMGVKDFTIDVSHLNSSRIKFEYNKAKLAYGGLSRDEVEEDQENVHGVLKVWDTPNENKKYTSIYDIVFFHDETPLKVLTKGTFKVPDATPASRNTEKDLNSRITKFSKKATWDSADEEATMETLRSGESSKKASAPAQVAQTNDNAYYDEDEDEDEYEESSRDQEERDYSRYGASGSASDVFGNSDEYLFWSGMAFLAAAIGTGVVGFLQNSKYSEADKALATANKAMKEIEEWILNDPELCKGKGDKCLEEAKKFAMNSDNKEQEKIYIISKNIDLNKDSKASYNTGRIIFFSAAAVSLALSITLFAW